MTNKAKIFEFLYKNRNSEYNINQISRLVGISVGSAFKILKDIELNLFSQFLIFSISGLIFHLIPDMIIYTDMRVYWPFSVISYGGLVSYGNVASFLFYLGSIALLILLIPLITQARKSARWNGKV